MLTPEQLKRVRSECWMIRVFVKPAETREFIVSGTQVRRWLLHRLAVFELNRDEAILTLDGRAFQEDVECGAVVRKGRMPPGGRMLEEDIGHFPDEIWRDRLQ